MYVTYTHSICLRTKHVPEEKVPKFNWIQTSPEKSPLNGISDGTEELIVKTHIGIRKPQARAIVECSEREQDQNYRQADEYDWIVGEHGVTAVSAEIEPQTQAQEEQT